jgi:hypothetical protein
MSRAFLLVPTTVLLLGAVDADKDTKQLQGTWSVVMAELGGKKVSKDELKDVKVIFQGNMIQLILRRQLRWSHGRDASPVLQHPLRGVVG